MRILSPMHSSFLAEVFLAFFINNLPSTLNVLNYEIYLMHVFNLYINGHNDYPYCYPRCGLSLPLLTIDLATVLAVFNGVVSNIKQRLEKGFDDGVCPLLLLLGNSVTTQEQAQCSSSVWASTVRPAGWWHAHNPDIPCALMTDI